MFIQPASTKNDSAVKYFCNGGKKKITSLHLRCSGVPVCGPGVLLFLKDRVEVDFINLEKHGYMYKFFCMFALKDVSPSPFILNTNLV